MTVTIIKIEKVAVEEINARAAADSIFRLLGGRRPKIGGINYEG